MELKLKSGLSLSERIVRSNRTFMELKCRIGNITRIYYWLIISIIRSKR